MELMEARALALELMKQHDLEFWHFEFDNAKRRFGICRYNRRTIGLSKNLVLLNNKEQVKDTILHEIAHALVGPGYGHSWVWKRMALEIGCNDRRCYSKEDTILVERTLIATCPKCGYEFKRFRKPKSRRCCGKCVDVPFEERLLIFERRMELSL